MNTTLETARLILRPFRTNDVDRLAELFGNADFMRFSSLGACIDREQSVQFIDKVIRWSDAGEPSMFAPILKSNQRLLGYCGFFHHPEDGIEDVEIGYRLDPEYWNNGLITEAARAVRDHGFKNWKLQRLISIIHPENIPSRRIAEKNGMEIEKEITFRGFRTLVYALTREKWQAMSGA